MLIKYITQDEEQEPTLYLQECITALNNCLEDEVGDRDLVGLRIRNTENVQDKLVELVSDAVTSLNRVSYGMYSPSSFKPMLGLF